MPPAALAPDPDASWQVAVAHVRSLARGGPLPPSVRVVLHLHPDTSADGTPALAAIARNGTYRSQFETGTSNGGLTAFPGGARWAWESRIFGGAYDDGPAAARPVYGALRLNDDPYGAATRFGSCHLVLRPHVLARTTFCYPDSAFGPDRFGTADRCDLPGLLAADPSADPLDRYVEAHVHGRVLLRDVQEVVLDPSFCAGPVEVAASRLGVPVTWHPGFRALPTAFDIGYRGEGPLRLAHDIAGGGALTPATLGPWRSRVDVDPRTLKQVWHLLARFGRDDSAGLRTP